MDIICISDTLNLNIKMKMYIIFFTLKFLSLHLLQTYLFAVSIYMYQNRHHVKCSVSLYRLTKFYIQDKKKQFFDTHHTLFLGTLVNM